MTDQQAGALHALRSAAPCAWLIIYEDGTSAICRDDTKSSTTRTAPMRSGSTLCRYCNRRSNIATVDIETMRELIRAKAAAIVQRASGYPDAAVAQQRLADELVARLADPESVDD